MGAAAAAGAGPYPFPGYAPQYPQPYMQQHHGATQLQADTVISLLTAISDKVGALGSAMQQHPSKFSKALQLWQNGDDDGDSDSGDQLPPPPPPPKASPLRGKPTAAAAAAAARSEPAGRSAATGGSKATGKRKPPAAAALGRIAATTNKRQQRGTLGTRGSNKVVEAEEIDDDEPAETRAEADEIGDEVDDNKSEAAAATS